MEEKKIKFAFGELEAPTLPTFSDKITTGSQWVLYGDNDKMPNYLYNELYMKSSTLQSAINAICDYVIGEGLDLEQNIYWKEYVNEDGDELYDIVKKCVIDREIFGGFALKVEKNSYSQVVDLTWLDFRNCRINEDLDSVWYWPNGKEGKYKNKFEIYDAFDPKKNYSTSILYFRGHNTRGIYPVPDYAAAIPAISTSTKIPVWHLNNISKNFSGNYIINYNSADYTDEDKDTIVNGIRKKFGGENAAGNIMVAFNNGKENAVTISKIPENTQDTKFENLRTDTKSEIYTSLRVIPQLCGNMDAATGFSTQEFKESFEVMNRTVVRPIQKDVQRVFGKIFEDRNFLQFIPFELTDNNTTNEENTL